jgi:small-conductance mechanosensitive channel
MFGWFEILLLAVAVAFFLCGLVRSLHLYRPLFVGAGTLTLIFTLYPRPGNLLGQTLFGRMSAQPRLLVELFGVAWWILGAWLVNGVLRLVLRRTLFPLDNQPHARRLFADLASVLVYIVALVGVMDTVLKEPISAVLATSGVLAIVLGLALQNTLSDVFSGLAITMERSFRAGDWITVANDVVGQVIEINWRATHIRTAANDLIVIPNSIVAKAIVTNHQRLDQPHLCTIALQIDHGTPSTRVIEILQAASSASGRTATGSIPSAVACGFEGALVHYELTFSVDDFTQLCDVRSDVIRLVADALQHAGIAIGSACMDVRIIRPDSAAGAHGAVPTEPLIERTLAR